MLSKRMTSYILLVINTALALFVILRYGSADVNAGNGNSYNIDIIPVSRAMPKSGEGWQLPDTLILNDFENMAHLSRMYRQGGDFSMELSNAFSSHGQSSLLIEKKYDSNIELATVRFPGHWRNYDRLQIDAFNDSDEVGNVWIRVGNRFDSRRFYVKSQKYSKSFILQPGFNTISIRFEELVDVFGRLPERKSLHINIPANSCQRLYLDYIRVVRR